MKFLHTLRFRVLAGSTILLMILFGVYSSFVISFHTDQMMSHVQESTTRVSDIIKKSVHYSMLLNRKEDVYQIITTIGKEQGVVGIRIYNKRGEIMFSTLKEEEHTIVDMHAEACYACHDQAKPLSSIPQENRMRIYTAADGDRVLGLINPIRNEAGCSNGGCHAHPTDRSILGVLDVRMSLAQVDQGIATAEEKLTRYTVISIGLVVLLAVFFLLRTIVTPLRQLMNGTEQISSGNLAHRIPVRSRDELGELALSFNQMTESLLSARRENEEWARTLEKRIEQKTGELEQAYAQIVQIEKMASLGKLAATVAHELNNPLEGILNYGKLIARRLRRDTLTSSTETLEDIDIIIRETGRCGTIVKNLLLFSKKHISEISLTRVKTIIDNACQIMQHHFEISNISIDMCIEDDTIEITCDEHQMQQALIALLVNAVEAMPEGGKITITVSSRKREDDVSITIKDSGTGISPDDLPHIFEPFFTTKANGKGTGLGLSVAFGIVERHGGVISIDSKPGQGAAFTIRLPRRLTGDHAGDVHNTHHSSDKGAP